MWGECDVDFRRTSPLGLEKTGCKPMVKELDTARRYRLHAEELRTIGDAAMTSRIKATLYNIAVDYDRMALSLETIRETRLAMATATATATAQSAFRVDQAP